MPNPTPNVRLCDEGRGWCVESLHEIYGPLETQDEARIYARLIHKVYAARTQIACTDDACWQ